MGPTRDTTRHPRSRSQQGRAAKIGLVTAKELLLREASRWSERDAEVALRAVQHEHEAESIVDDWGDLDAMLDHAARDTMRMLDEEEIAASGETLADTWARAERERPQ